ncbi:AAA family ATPase [Chitinophaga ginsengisoli]|uniref:ATPase family protein associated with various cellular activities (AAA) n=1 Tax=Chitinophaga ginsengisoli TaxID=363837 RepID=A0A2P8FVY6_9BACT|nr:ATP-binding protein [Chitinophaga ginsengisoli]PSL25876.1 ATPase family protein associated with various cellular activities (AAA) [Chitinophaga ginsengisoli]
MNVFDLLINDKEQVSFNDIFLEETNKAKIIQLIKEHTYIEELHQYGLPVNNKILLHGSSGCGKTMTAKAIAQALGKNILILNLSNIICARIGETSQNIKQVFDKAGREKAVLFLDEFDQIGKARENDENDVGEMRRLVNTLIQLMDYYPEKALLLCATNHADIIDTALLRRFQLRVDFQMPSQGMLDEYYDKLLSRFPKNVQHIERKYNISFAEARDYSFTIVKSKLIAELEARQEVHTSNLS